MSTPAARSIEVADHDAWQELAYESGWTDGLPVSPPTAEAVREIVEYLGRGRDEDIGVIPPALGIATVEQIAINCVMAGCRPEYVPVVIEGVKCMLEERFNLNGVQCTTNPCAPLLIVSGPAVTDLGFNYRENVFAGGSRVNATIGRAIRLILWNLGRGFPGETDMATLGHPGKFSFCVAENVEDSPWEPFHTDYGVDAASSAVTTFACDPPHALYIPGDDKRIMKILAQSIPALGLIAFHSAGQYMVIIAPKPARTLADAGWKRSDVKEYLFENARWNLGQLREMEILDETDHVKTHWGGVDGAPSVRDRSDNEMLPIVDSPDDIHVLVTGGSGQWWCAVLPGWGTYGGFAVTRPLEAQVSKGG